MNKRGFIDALAKELNCDVEYSKRIIDILDDNFIFGRKNKEKTINAFITELNIEKEEAEKIYEATSSIATTAIKDKIKNPFRKDK